MTFVGTITLGSTWPPSTSTPTPSEPTVLGRRNPDHDNNTLIDLHDTDLYGATLTRANLTEAVTEGLGGSPVIR